MCRAFKLYEGVRENVTVYSYFSAQHVQPLCIRLQDMTFFERLTFANVHS